MKKSLMTIALLLLFSLVLLNGCAGQNMNDPMHGSADTTMSEGTMKAGSDTMMEGNSSPDTMQNNMEDSGMEKTMK